MSVSDRQNGADQEAIKLREVSEKKYTTIWSSIANNGSIWHPIPDRNMYIILNRICCRIGQNIDDKTGIGTSRNGSK